MSTTKLDMLNRLGSGTSSSAGKTDDVAEPQEEEWQDAGKIQILPSNSDIRLPVGNKGGLASKDEREDRLPPARTQPRAKITAKVPHPADYSEWKNERGRSIGRAIARGAAAAVSFLGITGSFATGGFAIGSLFGGPLIGGLVGAGIGALIGAYVSKKSADGVEKRYAAGDKARFEQRGQANLDAIDALKTLKDKHWLTQPIADGWSKLSADQQRRLLKVDPDLNLSKAQIKDIQARTLLRVGQAMTEHGASVQDAFRAGLLLKRSLEQRPWERVPDDLKQNWKTHEVESGWAKLDDAQRQQLLEVDDSGGITQDQASYIRNRVMREVGQAMSNAENPDAATDAAFRNGMNLKHRLESELASGALPPKIIPSQEQGLNEAPGKQSLTADDYGPLPAKLDDLPKLRVVNTNDQGYLKSLVPKKSRNRLGEEMVAVFRQEQESAASDDRNPRAHRLPAFRDPSVGFGVMSDAFASDRLYDDHPRNEVDSAIHDTRKTAMMGLGIVAPGKPHQEIPASGLQPYHIARFKELAVTTAAIRERYNQPDAAKPLTKKEKAALQQQLDDALPWLDYMRKENKDASANRQAFTNDFQQLSRSPNLKALRKSQAKLDAIESELQLLDRYEELASTHFVFVDPLARGQQGADQAQQDRDRNDKLVEDRMNQRYPARDPQDENQSKTEEELRKKLEWQRKQDVIDTANFENIARKFPESRDRLDRVNQLKQQRTQLTMQKINSQKAFKKEVAPMVERYGRFGFDGDPHHWKPGGGGKKDDAGRRAEAMFSTMQSSTQATIDYIEKDLLPELQQKLDEIPSEV